MSKPDTIVQIRSEVDNVTNIMKANVEKILERDAKLGDLEDISNELQENANIFDTRTKKLKNKMWWANKKKLCILIFILLIFFTILGFIIYGITK